MQSSAEVSHFAASSTRARPSFARLLRPAWRIRKPIAQLNGYCRSLSRVRRNAESVNVTSVHRDGASANQETIRGGRPLLRDASRVGVFTPGSRRPAPFAPGRSCSVVRSSGSHWGNLSERVPHEVQREFANCCSCMQPHAPTTSRALWCCPQPPRLGSASERFLRRALVRNRGRFASARSGRRGSSKPGGLLLLGGATDSDDPVGTLLSH